jgi:serpin B
MRCWIALAGCAALLLTGVVRAAEEEGADRPDIVRGNTRFALDLYAALKGRPGNLFYAPASLSTALAMTHAGAGGATADQMAKVLHLDLPPGVLHPAFATLQSGLVARSDGRLRVANRLWANQGYPIRPDFLAITRDSYGAELAAVDFAHQPEVARRQINAWVERRTEDRIRDLLPPGIVDELTRLVLTNAVYFKGDWAESFPKSATHEADFHVTSDKTTRVPMMTRTGDHRHWAGDGLQVLELPYAGDQLSMVVILPDQADGLTDLENRLNTSNLDRWLNGSRPRPVQVFLPRFKLETSFELKDTLRSLGLTLPFDQVKANFSGITSHEDLYISAIVHKAFVDVNEEGTEAAAATAVVIEPRSAPIQSSEPAVFRADHPFVFAIRDRLTGSILFLGRVQNPNA